MGFTFTNINSENNSVSCSNTNYTSNEQICFGREQFNNYRIGCCGQSRKDSLYPIGNNINFKIFQKSSIEIMENYLSEKDDVWFIEQYLDKEVGDFRSKVKPVYEFYLNKDDKTWSFYENKEKIFTVNTLEELKERWIE